MRSREEHVRDLRILLDKSAEREAELAGMVRMVMEERFYRPSVTRDHRKPLEGVPMVPTVPIESLDDVSSFSEEADRKRIEEGEQIARELEDEFAEILKEHTAAHS